jgi:hypothetical protein
LGLIRRELIVCEILLLFCSNLLVMDYGIWDLSNSKGSNRDHNLKGAPKILIEIMSAWNYEGGADQFAEKIVDSLDYGSDCVWIVHTGVMRVKGMNLLSACTCLLNRSPGSYEAGRVSYSVRS